MSISVILGLVLYGLVYGYCKGYRQTDTNLEKGAHLLKCPTEAV